jgi:hypothetical protein
MHGWKFRFGFGKFGSFSVNDKRPVFCKNQISQLKEKQFGLDCYSLFVYFGNKSSEGAERLRGLKLSLFIIFIGYVIYLYNPVSVPQEKSDQKRQKMWIGSEMSEKTIKTVKIRYKMAGLPKQ